MERKQYRQALQHIYQSKQVQQHSTQERRLFEVMSMVAVSICRTPWIAFRRRRRLLAMLAIIKKDVMHYKKWTAIKI